MAVAAGLVVAAEVLATLSAATPAHRIAGSRPRKLATHESLQPHGGELQLSKGSRTPPAVQVAAVKFVRDYSAWQSGKLRAIPAQDATRWVIRMLERAGRHDSGVAADPAKSVRVVSVGTDRYLVASAIGNFRVDRHGSRWLVASLLGD